MRGRTSFASGKEIITSSNRIVQHKRTVILATILVVLILGIGAYVGLAVGLKTTTSVTGSSSSSSSSTSTDSSVSRTPIHYSTNESFQFVQATVGSNEDDDSLIVNATYHNNLDTSLKGILIGMIFQANTSYIPVTGGQPYGPICCPVVRSTSPSQVMNSSTDINSTPGSEFSSALSFSDLNNSSYLVRLYIVSTFNETMLLSPISYVYLQTINGTACGGQAGPDSTFYDQGNGLVYITDSGIDAVSVVNASTGRLVATISLPEIIGNLKIYLYDPGNQELYIGSQDSPQVFAIDTSTNYIVGDLTTSEPGQSLNSMIYDPANGKIFGINFVYSLVSVINDSTNNVITNITGIQAPLSGLYDPVSNAILVTAYNGTTFAIDANNYKVVGTLPANASAFLFDPDNKLLYAALGNNTITLNASTYLKVGSAFPLPNSYGNFVFYDSINKDIYFYNAGNFELIAISTVNRAIVSNISVVGIDSGLVVESPSFLLDSANGNIYATEVANPQNGTIALLLINGTTNEIVSQTFPSGLPLNLLSLDQSDQILYGVYGQYSSTIYSLNLKTGAIATMNVGSCEVSTLLP